MKPSMEPPLPKHTPHIRPFVCKDMIHENLLKSIDDLNDL